MFDAPTALLIYALTVCQQSVILMKYSRLLEVAFLADNDQAKASQMPSKLVILYLSAISELSASFECAASAA